MLKILRNIIYFICLCFISYVIVHGLVEYLYRFNPQEESKLWRGAPIEEGMKWTKRDNLIWFVQITDIHLSMYGPKERIQDLKKFLEELVSKVIRPSAVIATGDLVDSKFNFFAGEGLLEEEFRMYHQLLDETKIHEKLIWLDIRGNHDASKVESVNHEFYKLTRPQILPPLGQSYNQVIKTPFGSYNFVGLDLSPNPGLLLPVNFFGTLSNENKDFAKLMSHSCSTYNHTIWFSHYPYSIMNNPSETLFLRDITRTSVATIFGHLHINKNMYGRDPINGTLLLELGDWRNNRRFRIMAFDNDLFTFHDFHYHDDHSVYILVTNPKDRLYLSPNIEPTGRIRLSMRIRALIFSPLKITQILVLIDSHNHCSYEIDHALNNTYFDGSVFSCPWDPSKLDPSLEHTVQIIVLTENHKTTTYTHKFTLSTKFGKLPLSYAFMLMFNIALLAKLIFFPIFQIVATIPLIIFIFPKSQVSEFIQRIGLAIFPLYNYYFLNFDNYFPMLLFSIVSWLYPMGGRYEYLPNKYGHCTIFGTFVDGHVYHDNVIYLFYIEKMLLFNIPVYCHYFLRLQIMSIKARSHVFKIFIYRLISEIMWSLGFLITLIIAYHRAQYILHFKYLPINMHLYFPVIAIYLRLHTIKLPTKCKIK